MNLTVKTSDKEEVVCLEADDLFATKQPVGRINAEFVACSGNECISHSPETAYKN